MNEAIDRVAGRLDKVDERLDKVEVTIARESAETRGMIRLSYVEIDVRFRKLEDTVENFRSASSGSKRRFTDSASSAMARRVDDGVRRVAQFVDTLVER